MKVMIYNCRTCVIRIAVLLFLLNHVDSCTRKLDVKPDQSLIVPTSIEDFQAILDNSSAMNRNYPVLGEAGSDNYYLLTSRWSSLGIVNQNIYVWEKETYPGNSTISDWNNPYNVIFNANLVLDGLKKISSLSQTPEYQNAKGCALFFRAQALYLAAQIFCKPYNKDSASNNLGLPLRLSSDLLISTSRSTIQETYDRIISDLLEAKELLPETTSFKTRPSKVAANALLARIYLTMMNYDKAMEYSGAALSIYSTLIDFNTLTPASSFPFKLYNSEVIFHGELNTANSDGGGIFFSQTGYIVDSTLFKSYDQNDLRKTCFFNTTGTTYKGSYVGSRVLFGGLGTDELYLIRAESYARKGDVLNAMKDLNDLLRSRWKKVNGASTYIDQVALDANDALNKILSERKKELIFRGLRWVDLRRLNITGASIILTRSINNQVYALSPNESRYVYQIPQSEIKLSGIEDNPR